MLFYTLDKKGSMKSPSANGIKVNGAANGIKVTPNLAKRSLLADDGEADVKKRIKTDESATPVNMQELSKEERIRLKKERKRAKKLAKLNGSNPIASLNDYE